MREDVSVQDTPEEPADGDGQHGALSRRGLITAMAVGAGAVGMARIAAAQTPGPMAPRARPDRSARRRAWRPTSSRSRR